MKYSQWIGIAAVFLMVGACFMPWAYYPDLQKNFTGFFSEGNHYGRPGKFLMILGGIAIICFLIPKVWAKRLNLLVSAIIIAYAVKSFVLFTSCYNSGICPEKLAGIWIMLGSAAIVLLMALLPDTQVKSKS